MKWSFTYKGQPQTAEWRTNAMRCTMPEVIERVDTIIAEGGLVPCGSASHMVVPTLATEAGGYAAITLAIQEFADFMSLIPPLSEATVIGDVIIDANLEKGRQRQFASRSEAARYAAHIRWGNRSSAESNDERFFALRLDDAQLEVNSRQADMIESALGELPLEERHGIAVYTTSWYRHVNASLRGTTPPRLQMDTPEQRKMIAEGVPKIIRGVDSVMGRMPVLTEDVVVVRGMKTDKPISGRTDIKTDAAALGAVIRFSKLNVGDSFVDSGFMSTSSLKTPSDAFGGKVLLQVIIPKGMKALPVYKYSKEYEKEEMEWLLPRNTRFRVIRATRSGGNDWLEQLSGQFIGDITLTVVAEPA